MGLLFNNALENALLWLSTHGFLSQAAVCVVFYSVIASSISKNIWKTSKNVQWSWQVSGDPWQSSEIVTNLGQSSEIFGRVQVIVGDVRGIFC